MAKYTVDHTGGAYAGAGPRDVDYSVLSVHRTETAALKATLRAHHEMKRACGQNGWSNHFRAVIDGRVMSPTDCRYRLIDLGIYGLDGVTL